MRYIKTIVLLLGFAANLYSQSSAIPAYHTQTDFLLASPGAMGTGLYGYENPAMLNYLRQSDMMFTWSDQYGKWSGFDRFGFFAAIPHLGFGAVHQPHPDFVGTITDYKLSTGFGSKSFSMGLSYGWSSGDTKTFQRQHTLSLGYLIRPMRYVSLGLVGTAATAGGAREGIADLAVRPFGTEILTVFGDRSIQNKAPFNKSAWSAGAAVEALPGIRLTARYFDTKAFTAGINFSFGRLGIASQAHFDASNHHTYNTYAVRVGASDRNIFQAKLQDRKKYVELNLLGPLRYQRYVLFDKSNTLAKLLSVIEAAKNDPSVGGIAINASGMQIQREMVWELREKLKDFKSSGKRVIIYMDRAGITEYHLASIADKIVLDPAGIITLEGFVMGRTFLKGTLEKLGVGYDEWRFFKYKSANETFSRDKMSEGDREQRQRYIDNLYQLVKSEICASRKIAPEKFDALVNDEMIFAPQEALAAGLADTLGRWESVQAVIKQLDGEKKNFIRPHALAEFQLPYDNSWGDKPQIAVIYAIGECAMDQGIKARTLVKYVDAAANNSKIKAIVLRVDSPGGDGLASDIIAEALRKAKHKKPVIVSQGALAASGGYWLSMYADTIVAAPNTITGSIGVIGGWMYNNGLKEKIGLSTDFVKAGKHADLGFGMNVFGFGIPDRNLDENERAKAERVITNFYKEFVTKVAYGRKKTFDQIHEIAQGHFWSGSDGRENGLVDVIGGLETAITLAKQRAGIAKDEKIRIIEMPKPSMLDPDFLIPKFFGVEYKTDPTIEHLKFRLEHNGQPMPILPLDDMEFSIKY